MIYEFVWVCDGVTGRMHLWLRIHVSLLSCCSWGRQIDLCSMLSLCCWWYFAVVLRYRSSSSCSVLCSKPFSFCLYLMRVVAAIITAECCVGGCSNKKGFSFMKAGYFFSLKGLNNTCTSSVKIALYRVVSVSTLWSPCHCHTVNSGSTIVCLFCYRTDPVWLSLWKLTINFRKPPSSDC